MFFLPELDDKWNQFFKEEFNKPYFKKLVQFLEKEDWNKVYPAKDAIFNAFYSTPYDKVKVVIVGQDPYHGKGQAHGLAFSVRDGVALPPTLVNIYKEIERDVGSKAPSNGNLTYLAKQGVLLLNATLTVREGEPLSHAKKGWEQFTDHVITKLTESENPIVFVLWGNSAKKKFDSVPHLFKNSKHLVLTSSHPSPLSVYRGFSGCGHFSQINNFFKSYKLPEIEWN